jgi:hypothetical protein
MSDPLNPGSYWMAPLPADLEAANVEIRRLQRQLIKANSLWSTAAIERAAARKQISVLQRQLNELAKRSNLRPRTQRHSRSTRY